MTTTTATYIRWGRPRNSWHIVDDADLTICGRVVTGDYRLSENLPAAKSCETCLRIARRREDTAP